ERREERALALLEDAERRQRFLALGDVEARTDVACERAVAVEAGRAVIEHPAVRAVVTTKAILERERLSRVEGFGERRLPRPEILGMDARGPAVAEFVVERTPGEREPRAIDVDVAAVGIGHPERHRRLVRHHAKAGLALLERCTRAAFLRRVAEHEHEPAR